MKKLVLLLVAVLFTAVSAKVFAQSTGQKPYPGATHTYSVSANVNSTFEWKILTTTGTELTASDAAIDDITQTASGEQISVTWSADAVATTEYLVTVTEKVTATSCTNTKGLPIQITTSAFDLIVGVDGATKCYDGDVTLGWTGGQNATDITYDHGTATLACTVQATGIGASETWSFSLDLSYTQTDISATTVTVTDASSNAVTPVSGVYTLTGAQIATVSIVVDNANSYNNGDDADAQDFTATIALADVEAGTGAVESSTANNSETQDVARPNTSGISFN